MNFVEGSGNGIVLSNLYFLVVGEKIIAAVKLRCKVANERAGIQDDIHDESDRDEETKFEVSYLSDNVLGSLIFDGPVHNNVAM